MPAIALPRVAPKQLFAAAPKQVQLQLFANEASKALSADVLNIKGHSSNFLDNMRLPIHRWFRYSAGFSAEWVKSEVAKRSNNVCVLDPFLGSGTTCLACDEAGVPSIGVESHPFVQRVASAKLAHSTNVQEFKTLADRVFALAERMEGKPDVYSALIQKCYSRETLEFMDRFRQALVKLQDDSSESALVWLALVCSLRTVSEAGTAPWQYVLPGRRKTIPPHPAIAIRKMVDLMALDLQWMQQRAKPLARLVNGDARECAEVPDGWATLVLTSPPYANNYDYADATRLEMSFLGEIDGWGDLQNKVRKHLVRACSQHVPPNSVNIDELVKSPELAPIRDEIAEVCRQLSKIRLEKGGKKTYNNMIACYFHDLARVWKALRRCCASPSEVCFVIGDSAPYGIYVPVVEWFGKLALAAGFESWTFEKLRDRNNKWKNRKHRVPLCEGHLWVRG